MNVSEAFLVNTKNFDSIIDALVAHKMEEEPVVNSNLLEVLGYSDPNDLLVVRLLKDFDIINSQGEPGPHYDEFKDPATTKKALAKGMVHAYSQLFDQNPKIHLASIEDIKEAFNKIFDGKKTELIIKYISGTFQKVVTYVGVKTIDAVRNNESTETEQVAVDAEVSNNSTHKKNGSDIKRENIGDKSIDDLVKDFDAKKSSPKSTEEDIDITIKEYVKDEFEEDDQDDPFGLENDDITLQNNDTTDEEDNDNDQDMDQDPIDLEASLSSITSQHQTTDSMETVIKEHNFVQKALIRKSDLLNKMQRWDELLPTLEEIIHRYDDEDEHPQLKEAVSRSIIRRAIALLKLNRSDDALPALNTVISRFQNSDSKEFFDQASRAMLYKVQILEKTDSPELLNLYNTVIDRMDANSEILIKEKMDQIHLKRFDLILKEGEQEQILDASTKLIRRLKGSEDHRDYLQKAMIMRAEILDELERDEEALNAYDEFLVMFGD